MNKMTKIIIDILWLVILLPIFVLCIAVCLPFVWFFSAVFSDGEKASLFGLFKVLWTSFLSEYKEAFK